MQELDEDLKLHTAGGDDAPDTSDVSLFHIVDEKMMINLFSCS